MIETKKCPPPLKGLKVASFCWIVAGPVTVRYLGYWGATVVRVESHRRPDIIRVMTPYKDGIPGVDRTHGSQTAIPAATA